MIDVSKYVELKDKGVITVGKVGDAYVIAAKRFDQQTGEGLQPEIQAVGMEELQNKLEELKQATSSINRIIADCTALK